MKWKLPRDALVVWILLYMAGFGSSYVLFGIIVTIGYLAGWVGT